MSIFLSHIKMNNMRIRTAQIKTIKYSDEND